MSDYLNARHGPTGAYFVDPKQYTVNVDDRWWSDKVTINYDGKNYDIHFGDNATSNEINKIKSTLGISSPKEKTMIELDGRLYLYINGHWKWYTNSETLLKKIRSNEVAIPTHTK